MSRYLVYVDGACSHNGNDARAVTTGSFAVYGLPDGMGAIGRDAAFHEMVLALEPLEHQSRFIVHPPPGARPTNNIAEALSLQTALAWCLEEGILSQGNHVTVCMDSQLTLNQFAGLCRINVPVLRKAHRDMHAMLDRRSGAMLKLVWIPGAVMKGTIIGH